MTPDDAAARIFAHLRPCAESVAHYWRVLTYAPTRDLRVHAVASAVRVPRGTVSQRTAKRGLPPLSKCVRRMRLWHTLRHMEAGDHSVGAGYAAGFSHAEGARRAALTEHGQPITTLASQWTAEEYLAVHVVGALILPQRDDWRSCDLFARAA